MNIHYFDDIFDELSQEFAYVDYINDYDLFSVRAVRRTGQHSFRVGDKVNRPARQQQLWHRRSPGIFLDGASQTEALRWAQQLAGRIGGTVTPVPEQHGSGRPHFHISIPSGNVPSNIGVRPQEISRSKKSPHNPRSAHIYWGTPPTGDFFDYDY